ncbi:hypothetical protein E2C01_085611 [Portunus trituberculatus]|uniref:Uncharacterized protein n=1 Tax=Portunus trituberculatus TaxID=210409 RepID=A0A5B7J7B9_PORTR|nr:hypothetical protein [Portunus trituberculatus]
MLSLVWHCQVCSVGQKMQGHWRCRPAGLSEERK